MKNFYHIFNRDQKGFVILFTILIATVILMIGFGIFSVAIRETVLSGTAREAQKAFYAADAGVECALYADSVGLIKNDTGQSQVFDIPCGVGTTTVSIGATFDKHEFDLQVSATAKTCAHVTIFSDTTSMRRRIVAQGYNICSGNKPSTKNPLLVERDLDVKYSYGTPLTPTAPPPPPPGI